MYPLVPSNGEHLFVLAQTMIKEKDFEDEIIKITDPKVLAKFVEYCRKEEI